MGKAYHKNTEQLEFSYITDGIYVGTNVCCQAHFDEKLANEGITENISLEEEQIGGRIVAKPKPRKGSHKINIPTYSSL